MGEATSDSNGHAPAAESTTLQKDEQRLNELRELFGKAEGDPLRVVGVGAGAWGSVFIAMLQNTYGSFRDSIQVHKTLTLIKISIRICFIRS